MLARTTLMYNHTLVGVSSSDLPIAGKTYIIRCTLNHTYEFHIFSNIKSDEFDYFGIVLVKVGGLCTLYI